MVTNQWKKIGIQGDIKEVERGLAATKLAANEHQMYSWNNGGSEKLYLFPRHALPVEPTEAYMGILCAVELFSQADIDGGLIGGAALVADDFLAICQAAS